MSRVLTQKYYSPELCSVCSSFFHSLLKIEIFLFTQQTQSIVFVVFFFFFVVCYNIVRNWKSSHRFPVNNLTQNNGWINTLVDLMFLACSVNSANKVNFYIPTIFWCLLESFVQFAIIFLCNLHPIPLLVQCLYIL